MNNIIETYLSHLENNENFAVTTIAKHRKDLGRLDEFLCHQKLDILIAKAPDIAEWIIFRRKLDIKDRTIENELCVFRKFYQYLFDSKQIHKNPAASIPRVICEMPSERLYLTVAESMQLLNSFDRKTAVGLRDFTMLATLWSTGIRPEECTHLYWKDIDLDEGTLLVRDGKGGKQRQVFLNERIWDILQEYAWAVEYQAEDPVFFIIRGAKNPKVKKAFKTPSLNDLVKRVSTKAGLKKKICTMTFRHTFATHMFEAGVPIDDIKEMIGHEPETETCIYIHITVEGVKSLLLSNTTF